MKVLLAHNRYQRPGGEDVAASSEKGLVIARGHQVVEYVRYNDEVASYGHWRKATLMARTVWAWDSYREIKALLRVERPDVAHFHNTFPLISPAAYYACREAGVPVVQTLHNYRLLCPAATFLNGGRVCEACTERGFRRAIMGRCYRQSFGATLTVSLMLGAHRWLQTWTRLVDCYIALTEFARGKFIAGGLPPERVVVKPNFVYPDPHPDMGNGCPRREYALFVGRLSEEKGAHNLIAGWARLNTRIPLVVAGDGPLRSMLAERASRSNCLPVTFLGRIRRQEVPALLAGARFLVFPSECYETFGLAAVEAFACAVPVLASRIGALEELVTEAQTGLTFRPGDPDDLAAKVSWAWSDPDEMAAMGRAARAEYEAKYTAERNYEMLMEIYGKVLGAKD